MSRNFRPEIFRRFLHGVRNDKKEKADKAGKEVSRKKSGDSKEKLSVKNVTLIRTLGIGSFGRVFLAKAEILQNPTIAVKRLKKANVIKQQQVDHILSEKKILSDVYHPFVVNLIGTYKDERYLYIAMEYVIGGEFFTYLRRIKRCTADAARFYTSQLVLIFEYLHSKNIIYRDLKPENLLLDDCGYLKLADFGFAKVVETRTYTLCGTPDYIAPEILLSRGHSKPVDWWTLGILIYEMIVGYPPFYESDPMGVYQKILAGRVAFPSFFDRNAKMLCKHFLTADLTKRYGNLHNGVNDIKQHKWFEGYDWDSLEKKEMKAPYIPEVKNPEDTSNFEKYSDSIELPKIVPDSEDPFTTW